MVMTASTMLWLVNSIFVLLSCERLSFASSANRIRHQRFLTLDEYDRFLAQKRVQTWTKQLAKRKKSVGASVSKFRQWVAATRNVRRKTPSAARSERQQHHPESRVVPPVADDEAAEEPHAPLRLQLERKVRRWMRSVRDLNRNEMLFAVMASRTMEWRAVAMEDLVLKKMPHVRYVVEEYLDNLPRERQWKVHFRKQASQVRKSKNKDVWKVRKEYMKVQRQQLEFITQHPHLPREIEWVMLLDDDTWFDWDQMSRMLRTKDPTDPVLFSYILSDAQVIGYDYPCGGAGMVMSRAAYDLISKPLADDSICPFVNFNDLTLGLCLSTFQVPMVHSELMHCMPTLNMASRSWENLNDVQEQVAFHRLIASTNLDGLIDMLSDRSQALEQIAGLGAGCRMAPKLATSDHVDSRMLMLHERMLPRFVEKCNRAAGTGAFAGPTTSGHAAFSSSTRSSLVSSVARFNPEAAWRSDFDPGQSSLLFQLFDDFHIPHMQARKFAPADSIYSRATAKTLPVWLEGLVRAEGTSRASSPSGGTTESYSRRHGRPTARLQMRWKLRLMAQRAFPAADRISFSKDHEFTRVLRQQLDMDGKKTEELDELRLEDALSKRFSTDRVSGLPDWVDVVVRNFRAMSPQRSHGVKDLRTSSSSARDKTKCGSSWTFLSFYASTTYVNLELMQNLIRDLHELFPCERSVSKDRLDLRPDSATKIEELHDLIFDDDPIAAAKSNHADERTSEMNFDHTAEPQKKQGRDENADDPTTFDLVSGQPPLAVAYIHTESHIEPAAGVLLNEQGIRRLETCTAKDQRRIELHPEIHKFISVTDELSVKFWKQKKLHLPQLQLQDNLLGVDVYNVLKFCGVFLVHSRRFAPNLTGLITYSTWRRPHRAPISELVTAGQVWNHQRMVALTIYGEERQKWLALEQTGEFVEPEAAARDSKVRSHDGGREQETAGASAPSSDVTDPSQEGDASFLSSAADEIAAPPTRFRFEKNIEQSRIPGGIFVGDIVMTYRSEHFLADAQATNDKRIRKKDET
ncbi:unnamed protein product [Amoebophrya sp. A120]|nr:unnamed protein product [Amoebophrya sp. A120]|eukprot:GSA120T00022746001.1